MDMIASRNSHRLKFPAPHSVPVLVFPFTLFVWQSKKVEKKVEEKKNYGPKVQEGTTVFGVAHICQSNLHPSLILCNADASFNDTFVHVTDISGKETIIRVTGELSVAFAA